MPHQVALTVVAPVRDGARGALQQALAAADVPFGELRGVHFARIFTLDADIAADGTPTREKLVLMSDVDALLERHLRELSDRAGPALDPILRHCDGYPEQPDADARRAYLRAHIVPAAASYVNTVGRGLEQVLLERRLRERVEDYLDLRRGRLEGRSALDVRGEIQRFVADDESLRPALRRASRPGLLFRLADTGHLVVVPLALVAVSPLGLLSLPVYVALLRAAERRDEPDDRRPDDAHVEALAALEDHHVQNPFTAAGNLKPGRLRRLTASAVLFFADYAVRHVFNDGNLAGVKTIHFARWVFLDGKRRVVFVSNYDGSLESYMDDFIDKVAWGLNAVFSNGVGYPRTRWLLKDGARDERAFKHFLRVHQAPTQVWYSAYADLTARNLQNNARLRAGLSGPMTEEEAAAWLQRL